MNAESLLDPKNKHYLELQEKYEAMLHNKMRLNTCYSAKHLQMAIDYRGPKMTFRTVLDAAVDREKFKYVQYDGRIFYYRGIPIIREMEFGS